MVLRLSLLHVLTYPGFSLLSFQYHLSLMFSIPILNVIQILNSYASGIADSLIFIVPIPFSTIFVKGMEIAAKTYNTALPFLYVSILFLPYYVENFQIKMSFC